jgi:Kef-type K+ transport system membrane component KefB
MGTSSYVSLSLAVLTMASSPAGILRVINQQRASGQVTERMLHLSAFNCMLAVIAFYVTIALLQTPSTKLSLDDPAIRSVIMLVISMILGALLGVILPVVLRRLGSLAQDATIAFALSVILLVAFTHAMKLSPALAALTFGLTARHRQVTLSYTQRNFGALGDLLTVLLFVYITSALPWQRVLEGAALGVALIAVRLAAKTITIAALAPVSGISLQKGILTGIGLAPFSVFVILTLAQTQYAGIPLASELANLEAIAAMALFLEIIGPILTQLALILANETTQQ